MKNRGCRENIVNLKTHSQWKPGKTTQILYSTTVVNKIIFIFEGQYHLLSYNEEVIWVLAF